MGQLKVYIRIAQLSAGNNKAVFKPVTLGQDFVGKQIFQGDAAKVDQNQLAAKVLDRADEGPLARQDDPGLFVNESVAWLSAHLRVHGHVLHQLLHSRCATEGGKFPPSVHLTLVIGAISVKPAQ
jgi:hypothetical protein